MRQVILIPGMPDEKDYKEDVWPAGSNAHWFAWVQKQLSRQDILCQSLEMPHPYNPTHKDHCFVMNQVTIHEETVLVGHSLGAGFLLRYLSENKGSSVQAHEVF